MQLWLRPANVRVAPLHLEDTVHRHARAHTVHRHDRQSTLRAFGAIITFCCGPVTPSIALALFQNEHVLGTISAILMFHFVPGLIGMHPNIGYQKGYSAWWRRLKTRQEKIFLLQMRRSSKAGRFAVSVTATSFGANASAYRKMLRQADHMFGARGKLRGFAGSNR